ncbi:MAG: hypothetical protein ACFN1H_05180 [Propionibacterium freudenreichii]
MTVSKPETAPEDLAAMLAAYLGGDGPAVAVTDFLRECVAAAAGLVAHHVGTADVPPEIRARAITEVAAELFNRRNAPNGVASFGDGAGGVIPVRVARDALVAARPLLAPWLGWGLA